MSINAQWRICGTDQNGLRQSVYLCSPDLKNPKKAKKRASDEAKRRWLKKGLKVRVAEVECVG